MVTGRNASCKNVDKVLEELSDGCDICLEMRDVTPLLLIENGDQYYVNVRGIIDRLRLLDVQTLVQSRFGVECARLFKVIIDFKYIGERQLGEICLMNLNEVRQCLYTMMNENYLEVQEIPRSVDRDPHRTYYAWYVPWIALHEKVLCSMYNCLGNLLERKQLILTKQEELSTQLPTSKSKAGQRENLDAQLQMANNALAKVQVAITKLLHQIMLHRDF
ncbi:polymerase (RNA) III (DNA directed) polypeptide C [Reticulomyxa filosa]|uniref:DNA-directed RNA polymerase III subunit RPC3 n=1 Tax=Reticulomyxa filosa TaxID=46433 RepID=X6M083_RETFI|nr:polymerase (RNA) III (DNA directed) polypeptide C [Reticulomyxa filosa]|eukprot:ETO06807.1 polymerase (RNA) III (DNA directed) polypeptide C [Reticulomyxa filosa]